VCSNISFFLETKNISTHCARQPSSYPLFLSPPLCPERLSESGLELAERAASPLTASDVRPEIAVGRKINGFADLSSDKRKCTDCFFLLLFMLYWAGLIAVAVSSTLRFSYRLQMPDPLYTPRHTCVSLCVQIISAETGEIERLVYGVDANGVVCGTGVNSEKFHIYYPKLQEELTYAVLQATQDFNPLDVPLSGVCLERCPQPDDDTLPVCPDDLTQRCVMTVDGELVPVILPTSEIFYRCIQEQQVNSVVTAKCILPDNCREAVGLPSTSACSPTLEDKYTNGVDCTGVNCKAALESYFRACDYAQTNTSTTQFSGAKDDPLYDSLQSWGRLIARWIGDVQKSAAVILILGGLGSLILSTGYLIFLRYCTGCMVWLTVIVMYSTLIALTVILLLWGNVIDGEKVSEASSKLAGDVGIPLNDRAFTYLNQEAVMNEKYYAYLGYAMLVLDFIFFLLILFMWNRIKISIGIIKESTKTLSAMPSIVFVPILSVIATVFSSLYFLVVCGYIASSDNITE
jgi:hypothetical protein